MKLLKVQIALMYSVVSIFIVTCIDVVRKLLVKVLNDFTILDFSALAIKLDDLNVSLLWNISALATVIFLIAWVVLMFNSNERETAKATNYIRNFCKKDLITDPEDKDDNNHNRDIKRYNKVISRLKVIVDNDTATFVAKFDNLADKNAFLENEDLIIQEVKSSLPGYTFGAFERDRMTGKKIDG